MHLFFEPIKTKWRILFKKKKEFFSTLLLLLLFFLSECTSKQKLLCVFHFYSILLSLYYCMVTCLVFEFSYSALYIYIQTQYIPILDQNIPYMVCMIVSNEPWKSTRKLLVFPPFRKAAHCAVKSEKSAIISTLLLYCKTIEQF